MNQRKHELQKNELANFLTQEFGEEGNWIPKVVIGLVAAAAIGVVVNYMFFQESTAMSAGWQGYFHALGDREITERMSELAEKEAATPVGLWAKQTYGDAKMAKFLDDMIVDPETFKKSVGEAEAAYEEVSKKATDPLLKARAFLGLAKAQEFGGKYTEAIESYREVAKLSKGTPVAGLAEQGIERLSNPDQVAVLEWLAKEDLRPSTEIPGSTRPAPLPGRPSIGVPGLEGGASADPLKLPGLGDEKKPAEEKPAEEKPADAPAAEKPAEEKPAEPAAEKPAEEKPAEPAAEKPAEEKPAEPAATPAEPAAEEKK